MIKKLDLPGARFFALSVLLVLQLPIMPAFAAENGDRVIQRQRTKPDVSTERSPSPSVPIGSGLPGMNPASNDRQQKTADTLQAFGNAFNQILRQQQEQADRQEEEEQLREQRELIDQQREELNRLEQERLSSLGGPHQTYDQLAYDRANLPQDINERLATLQILAQRDPARYGGLLRETEAEYARLGPRPLFSEPLSSFVGSPGAVATGGRVVGANDSTSPSGLGSAGAKGAEAAGNYLPGAVSRRYLTEILKPSQTESESLARDTKLGGKTLRKFRYGVLGELAEQNKENSMGFAPVMNAWMEYNEDVTAEAGTKGTGLHRWNFPSIRNAGAKVREAWKNFLDEGLVKDLNSLDDK